MADPTPESNLAQIQELQKLITAEYVKPDGPEFSYPAVGQAVDDEMWKFITLALGSGSLDMGGHPYNLVNPDNTNNTATLKVSTVTGNAQALVNGFYHRLLQDMSLSFPMPLTETVYFVVLELNPLKASSPEGPISVQVYPNEVNKESGRTHIYLWSVKRKPNQLLTDAEFVNLTPKLAPVLQVDMFEALPLPETQLWGTLALVGRGTEPCAQYRAGGSSKPNGGPGAWVPVLATEWRTLILSAGYEPFGSSLPRYRFAADGGIELRGAVKKSSGDLNKGKVTYLARIPDIEWDGWQYQSSTGTGARSVRVDTTNGGTGNRELSYYTEDSIGWLSLDGMKFWIKP